MEKNQTGVMGAIIVGVGGCENPDIGDQRKDKQKKLTKKNFNQLLTPKTFCWTMIIELFLITLRRLSVLFARNLRIFLFEIVTYCKILYIGEYLL